MGKASISLGVLALTLSMTACKKEAAVPAPAPDTQADSQAIRDGETAWSRDWQTKDVNKITSYYAPDAALLLANMPVMTGMDAIKAGVEEMFKDPHLSLTFSPTVVVVAKAGDVAYTQGVYTMTYSAPKTGHILIEKGKYVTVYRKQPDGSWKAEEDSANADAPAAPAKM